MSHEPISNTDHEDPRLLEAHLAAGSKGAQEVVLLSFLEHLGADQSDRGEQALRDQLGSGLRAALDEMEAAEFARDPDSEILRHFEWPEGWRPDKREDGNPEPPTC